MRQLLACWMPSTDSKAGMICLPVVCWVHMPSPRVAASPTRPSPIFTHSTKSCIPPHLPASLESLMLPVLHFCFCLCSLCFTPVCVCQHNAKPVPPLPYLAHVSALTFALARPMARLFTYKTHMSSDLKFALTLLVYNVHLANSQGLPSQPAWAVHGSLELCNSS